MPTINIGIVAHVDAGKTSLTERILYETHVIDAIGRVDQGTTQTDSLELERRRGITIKASVVSFCVGDLKVNLIDTPGHADFLAEVERSLSVLDGAILLISAVEGIQPQTRILFSALTKLRIPTILFVNKIDRMGAQETRLLQRVRAHLTPHILPLQTTERIGTKSACVVRRLCDPEFYEACVEQLAARDESLLATYLHGVRIDDGHIREALRRQVGQAQLYPVLFGSAITGAGVPDLLGELATLLPSDSGQSDAPLSGVVFKLEQEESGAKVAYVRVYAGSLRVKASVDIRRRTRDGQVENYRGKIQRLQVFQQGKTRQAQTVPAGELCKVWGLREIRVGDVIGAYPDRLRTLHFATPRLEARIDPVRPEQGHHLYQALSRMAEEDPLISILRDGIDQALYLRFFGEVQREVIETTLAERYGIPVCFAETGVVCVEKPRGTGHAIEVMGAPGNPFIATVGFRIEPGPPNSGVTYRRPSGALPLAYYRVIEDAARASLAQGLCGWEVTDIIVTLTATARTPATTGTDFRNLTPLVLMQALANAGMDVYEPINQFELSTPAQTIGTAMFKLSLHGATYEPPIPRGDTILLTGTLPLATTEPFKRELASFTGGEGVFVAREAGVRKKAGELPTRARRDYNPLNRQEYLMRVQRVV